MEMLFGVFMSVAIVFFIGSLIAVFYLFRKQQKGAFDWISFDKLPGPGQIVHILVEDTEARENMFWKKYHIFLAVCRHECPDDSKHPGVYFIDEDGNFLHPSYKPLFWRNK